MKVVYDPHLVGEVVHLLARDDERRWREYRSKIDRLYDQADRGPAFDAAHLALFAKWGVTRHCDEALAALRGPELAIVARSLHPGDEGADLLVGVDLTVSLRLAADRFLDAASLRRFLNHQVRHLHDMLAPAFGYERDLPTRGRTRAQRELVRGRYHVLWNLAIDAVEEPPVERQVRMAQLAAAFTPLDTPQLDRLASRFADPKNRTHGLLAAAAADPWTALGETVAGERKPGEPCPLCGFPTYDWDPQPPKEPILADQPDWRESTGACRQCADIYRAIAKA